MCIVCILSRLVFRHASHTHTHIWAETDPLGVLMSEAEKPYTCGGGCVGGHERLIPASVVKSIFAFLWAKQSVFCGMEGASAAATQVEAEGRQVQ